MNGISALVRFVACALLLSAAPTTVRAELFFVPIDGSNKNYSPREFGYHIKVTRSGGLVHVYIELDEAAATSFKGGLLRLTKGRDAAIEVTLGLARRVGDSKRHLRFAFDPKAVDGGEAIICSNVIRDRPVPRNFGGFQLSIKALLARDPKLSAQNPDELPRSPAAERDPEKAFRKACELVAALEGKQDLFKGVSKVKPVLARDEQGRLKSAELDFENNAVRPGKNDARAKDASRPFFCISVQVWSGRTPSPPGNLHEFAWQGQTYQMWVRVYGSDGELVKTVRKSIDDPLREPIPDNPESRKRLRAVDSGPKKKKAAPDLPAQEHRPADVVLIADWLTGKDARKFFAKPFGDRKFLTDGADVLFYTDIPGVKRLVGLKPVHYQIVQARMGRIRRGNLTAPAVVIVRSSLVEPAEGGLRGKTLDKDKSELDGRVYFVEVAIGNLAWHRIKVVIRDDGEKPKARILWHEKS